MKSKSNVIRDRSASSVSLDVAANAFCVFVLIITLYPVLHLMALSFSSEKMIWRNSITIFPQEFTISSYKAIWLAGTVPRGMLNSLIYTAIGTTINMVFTVLMAYPMSKKRLPFQRFFVYMVLVTMYFNGGLIPTFMVVKGLGLYNSVWALTLPGAISAGNMIILRTFFRSLPEELEESAFLDGANDWIVLFRIVLPTAKAGLATITLFYLVGHWNSWFGALIYMNNESKYPLQLILRNIVLEEQMMKELVQQGRLAEAEAYSMSVDPDVSVDAIKYATIFISIAPMLVVYPFIQKYFVKGVMIGSLKE